MRPAQHGDRGSLRYGRADGVRPPSALAPVRPRDEAHPGGRLVEGAAVAGVEDDAVGVGHDRAERPRRQLRREGREQRVVFPEDVLQTGATLGELRVSRARRVSVALAPEPERCDARPSRAQRVRGIEGAVVRVTLGSRQDEHA